MAISSAGRGGSGPQSQTSWLTSRASHEPFLRGDHALQARAAAKTACIIRTKGVADSPPMYYAG